MKSEPDCLGDTTIKTYASRRRYDERALRTFKQAVLVMQVHNRPFPVIVKGGVCVVNRRSNGEYPRVRQAPVVLADDRLVSVPSRFR